MINYYYPRSIRTIMVALEDVFDDLIVYNYSDSVSGSVSDAVAVIPVPIKFSPQDKRYKSRAEEETGKRDYLALPQIAILWKGCEYDSARATGTNEYRYFYNSDTPLFDLDSYFEDTQPAPYNINFDMKIRTNSIDHMCQIVEQILPYFNPTIMLRIKEFSFLNIERNAKVKIDSINLDYIEEIDQDNRRELNGSISIVVETVLYKMVDTANIIKEIISRFYINNSTSAIDVSGSDTGYNKLVETYRTSGFDALFTSAFPDHSLFETSAYDPLVGVYTFTSSVGYD